MTIPADSRSYLVKLRACNLGCIGPEGLEVFLDEIVCLVGANNTGKSTVLRAYEAAVSVSLGELSIDPGAALVKSSHVGVVESHGQTRWHQQGTGSQRALFWSMLEVRSELNRIAEERKQAEKAATKTEGELNKAKAKRAKATKPTDIAKLDIEISELESKLAVLKPSGTSSATTPPAPFLPGYMLLIDEPETALHPAAIRAAKEHLYSLATESGWQVMLSTHHPAFVDPLKDHTTIVRLHRPEAHAPPNMYRSDSASFSADEKETLKTLLAFDQSVAEMFFSHKVVIVEGDTEFAAFTVAMDADPQAFPLDGRPLLLRARGKWTIPLLVRMLTHFKVSCAVLHDVDAPKVGPSGNKNGAYAANDEITKAVKAARDAGIHIIHRCSEPDFERKHGMSLPSKDKPFKAWKATKDDATIRKSVRKVLDELCAVPNAEAANHADDGRLYETKCKAWANANAAHDPAFIFD